MDDRPAKGVFRGKFRSGGHQAGSRRHRVLQVARIRIQEYFFAAHGVRSSTTYYIIATAEASSNLARYDGIRYTSRAEDFDGKDSIDVYHQSRALGFGEEVKRRVILGTYVLSSGYYDAYYLKAQKCRTLIRSDFENAFESVDAIMTPDFSDTRYIERGTC